MVKQTKTLELGDRVCLLGRHVNSENVDALVGTVIELRTYNCGFIRDRVLVRWDGGWEGECSENTLRALPRALRAPRPNGVPNEAPRGND